MGAERTMIADDNDDERNLGVQKLRVSARTTEESPQVKPLPLLGTTVLRGTRNFEPSRGIWQLPRIFYVFAEFCWIQY